MSNALSEHKKLLLQDPGPDADFRAGRVTGGSQALVGVLYPGVVALFFNDVGGLGEIKEREIFAKERTAFQKGVLSSAQLMDRYRVALFAWLAELGFEAGPIAVQPFWIPERNVGIDEVPRHLREAEDAELAANMTPSERDSLLEDLAEWRREGMYVFWWGKDYWMTRNGEIDST